jgi:hypothetical protein
MRRGRATVATLAEQFKTAGLDALPETLLPKRPPGRLNPRAEALYGLQIAKFCDRMRQIQSRMDFKVGVRGWCYMLEEHGLRKGDFPAAEALITQLRKTGDLPLDICADDASRATVGLERLHDDDAEDEADSWIDHLRNVHESYLPISFWDDKEYYIEVVVEKLDLRSLFEPVCKEFRVPITNFKGWSDLNSRADMMRRFKEHEEVGRQCVLLLCGDHDPGGLLITNTMRKNIEDLSGAVGWTPEHLIIERFGLNADFIEESGLTWIDNLETSSGGRLDDESHDHHAQEYVQNYIKRFGARKCEANALVRQPEIGRQLCRDAILEYLPEDAPEDYEERLAPLREELRQALEDRIV